MNDEDLPNGLADDQCALAMNVEWFYSTLGERRLGCETYDITGSGFQAKHTMVHLAERFPNNNISIPEYWGIAATVGNIGAIISKKTDGIIWNQVFPTNIILENEPNIYQIQSQSLGGKLFFAYESAADRLNVWDGTSLRPTGLAEPEAPAVANEGSGTYSGARSFRVRYIAMNGATILRRSEPSPQTDITPSGTGAGVTITRPLLLGEGETHWELEAASDGVTFWRIQTLSVATTTATDETNLTTVFYSDLGPVSEPIGNYDLIPSVRFIASDGDRLLLGGHWTDQSQQSRVSWTPVVADPGVGNDERLPLASGGDNYVNLDNYEGGSLTGIGQITNGTWYAFKWHAIYKMARTGDLTHAYEPICITKERGALPGSIVGGLDEAGRACLYFLDPAMGPCSLGAAGLRLHPGLRNTWQRVTFTDTGIICRRLYNPEKQQVHWWLAVDGVEMPGLKFVLQVTSIRTGAGGSAVGGWSLADGFIATANAVAIWHEIIETSTGVQKLSARPFMGVPTPDYIQRCDTGDDDNGVAYRAVIQSKPYFLAGLLNKWGSMTTAILATASDTANLVVSCIRDFGLEQTNRPTDLAPQLTEEFVIKPFDDLVMSDAVAVQFQFADP